MPRNPFARPLLLAAFLILVSLRVSAAVPESQTAKVSTFGKYSGHSEAVYDGWVRSSRYVTARDGTRLAVDVFRPEGNSPFSRSIFWLRRPEERTTEFVSVDNWLNRRCPARGFFPCETRADFSR